MAVAWLCVCVSVGGGVHGCVSVGVYGCSMAVHVWGGAPMDVALLCV